MANQLLMEILNVLQALSPVYILFLEFVVAYGLVLALFRFFGKEGLLIYIAMAIIVANIQVLKLVIFPFYPDPIPLGTVVFVSSFLAIQIINEHYGKDDALRAVKLSFVSYLCFVLLMGITLAFSPISLAEITDAEQVKSLDWAFPVQKSLEVLFAPAPSILVASLTAFFVGQILNVYVFSKLNQKFKGGFLWGRSIIASSLGNLIDNAVFSFVAFVLLAQNPLAFEIVFFSYILGVFALRFVTALLETPILLLSYKFFPVSLKIAKSNSKSGTNQTL